MTVMTAIHPLFLLAIDQVHERLVFGAPESLWALFLLLPLGWFFFQADRKRSELLGKILAPRLQQLLAGRVSPRKRTLRALCLLLSLALLVLSLAKPRFGYAEEQIQTKGRDVIIAIDTSRSMLSTDTAPTRLGRAKLIAQDLLNLLGGDRVGLIAFAGDAFLEAPLTLDKGAVLTSINDLDINTIPKGGTDIASAIRMAIAAFGKGEGTSRALVLMTDGEELDENAVEAAKDAAAAGIKIFTIGFGSARGSLIPIKNDQGENDFVRDENGQPVNSKLDAARLTEIAAAAGGFYQPYNQDAAQIIYDKGIVPINPEEMGMTTARHPIERYAWPATAALFLLTLWSLLGEGRSRKFLKVTAMLVALLFAPAALRASGITDYQQGNYDGALKDFEQRLQSEKASPEIEFDAGTAAYKVGDYKKAAGYFSEAMTSQNSKIRDAATYNLANSLVRTGEAAKEDDAKLSDWKNSLQHYETVMKSAPGNTQAKENRDIVKKLIEDLKKQQEQKKQQQKNDQKNDQKKDQNKDQKDQKDQQKNDQSQGGGKSSDQKNDQKQNQDQKNDRKSQNNQQNQQNSQGSKEANSPNQTPQNQSPQGQPSPQQGGSPTPTPSPSPDQGQGSNSQQPDQQNQPGSTPEPQPTPGEQNQQPGSTGQPTPAPSPTEKKEGAISDGQQGKKSQDQAAAAAEAADDQSKDGQMSPNQARALLRSVQDEEAHQLLNQTNRASDQPLHDW